MLSIQNLSHTYGNGVQALSNVCLDIPNGMFGLLGPNGAGKSSLMRTIATLQQPTAGEVCFDGENVLKNPDCLRRVLGYLPQDFGVYPRGSAYELLDYIATLKGLVNRKQRKNEVEHLLRQTNLYEAKNKRVSTFSGGMRQRFGVAQALLGKPKLIIVDEPTAGLDPEERNRFHNLLAEIGENIVVILSTHIVEDVADLCPNMAVMAKGQITLCGTPSHLKQQLQGKIWQKQILKSDLSRYQKNYQVISNHLSAGKMNIRIFAKQPPVTDFEAVQANLEDVYFLAVNGRAATLNDVALQRS